MYLKSNETHPNVRLAIVRSATLRDKVSDEAADGANEHVAEPVVGVDLDHDGGGVLPEKLLLHTEHELIVPRRVVLPLLVHAGRQLPLGVHPRRRVCLHRLRHQLQILGGDDVDLQQLVRFGRRRHFGLIYVYIDIIDIDIYMLPTPPAEGSTRGWGGWLVQGLREEEEASAVEEIRLSSLRQYNVHE